MLKGFLSWNMCFPPISLYETDIPSVYSRTRDCGIHAFFSEITHFFRSMRDIPALKLNDVHLLFEGKRLPSLKSNKSLYMQLGFFLNRIHLHCCQLKPTYSVKELLPFINTIDQTRFFGHFYIIDLQKKVTTRDNQNFIY